MIFSNSLWPFDLTHFPSTIQKLPSVKFIGCLEAKGLSGTSGKCYVLAPHISGKYTGCISYNVQFHNYIKGLSCNDAKCSALAPQNVQKIGNRALTFLLGPPHPLFQTYYFSANIASLHSNFFRLFGPQPLAYTCT